MTTVEVVLPDDLAEQAQRAGLLANSHVESWLREELRQQRISALLAAMDRAVAVDDGTEMSPQDVSEELRAMRAEERRSAR